MFLFTWKHRTSMCQAPSSSLYPTDPAASSSWRNPWSLVRALHRLQYHLERVYCVPTQQVALQARINSKQGWSPVLVPNPQHTHLLWEDMDGGAVIRPQKRSLDATRCEALVWPYKTKLVCHQAALLHRTACDVAPVIQTQASWGSVSTKTVLSSTSCITCAMCSLRTTPRDDRFTRWRSAPSTIGAEYLVIVALDPGVEDNADKKKIVMNVVVVATIRLVNQLYTFTLQHNRKSVQSGVLYFEQLEK